MYPPTKDSNKYCISLRKFNKKSYFLKGPVNN